MVLSTYVLNLYALFETKSIKYTQTGLSLMKFSYIYLLYIYLLYIYISFTFLLGKSSCNGLFCYEMNLNAFA
jgi:hypothetical protein